MLLALTRAVPPSITRCELTYLERTPIDPTLAAAQHERYEAELRTLGCTVERVPPEPELPDSVFVEDAAVVLDEVAIITRPGAASRRPETASVAAVLRAHRPRQFIRTPGTLDGGDVVVAARCVFVGLSSRTNQEGARQLRELLAPFGYSLRCIEVRRCLHLKSAVTAVTDDVVVHNPQWVGGEHFPSAHLLEVHPEEPYAANVLRLGDTLLCSAHAPRTHERLETLGIATRALDVSELAKAEAGLTCCSLIIPGSG